MLYYSKYGSKCLELDRLVYLGALGFEKRCVSLNGKQKAHATVIRRLQIGYNQGKLLVTKASFKIVPHFPIPWGHVIEATVDESITLNLDSSTNGPFINIIGEFEAFTLIIHMAICEHAKKHVRSLTS